ncbi:MAG: xanthine dehydrogenase YagS FAD-binding subunit [Planctomycetota bacterium]|jgi:xanthine dehydrogenase YagS FAD-binding subunit
MKAFRMTLPASVKEAVAQLPAEFSPTGAQLLAGGQDLLTELKEYIQEPDTLVNLKSAKDAALREFAWQSDGSLVIGALTTVAELEEDQQLAIKLTVLSEAAASIASPQIRSTATVGGNLNQRPRCWYYRNESSACLKRGGVECFSYYGKNRFNAILGGGPSYIVHPSDLAPALIALDAEISLVSPRGERVMLLEDYYTLPSSGDVLRETVATSDEVLTQVRIPKPAAGMRSTYLKFKERRSYDWALSAVALVLYQDGSKIRDARLVLGGVAPRPWRVQRTENKLKGRQVGEEAMVLARESALDGAEPLSENGFKVPLTKGLITRAFQRLA